MRKHNKSQISRIFKTICCFLDSSERFKCIYLLVLSDFSSSPEYRHGLKDSDIDLMGFLNETSIMKHKFFSEKLLAISTAKNVRCEQEHFMLLLLISVSQPNVVQLSSPSKKREKIIIL